MNKLLTVTTIAAAALGMTSGAKAQTPHPAYMSFFDGKTTLQNAGTIPNLPASSPYAFFYAVYKLNGTFSTAVAPLVTGWQSTNPSLRLQFALQNNQGCPGKHQIAFSLGPVSGSTSGSTSNPIQGGFPNDPANIQVICISNIGYHTILAGINTRGAITPHSDGTQSQTVITAMVDGQAVTSSVWSWPGQGTLALAPFDIAWDKMTFQLGTVAATKAGAPGGAFSGDLAFGLWVPPTSYGFINPSTVASNFLDAEGGPLPFQYMSPTGMGYIPNLTPQIWFSGGPVLAPFAQRGSGLNLVNGGPAGIMVMDSSTDPAFFKTTAGALMQSNPPGPF